MKITDVNNQVVRVGWAKVNPTARRMQAEQAAIALVAVSLLSKESLVVAGPASLSVDGEQKSKKLISLIVIGTSRSKDLQKLLQNKTRAQVRQIIDEVNSGGEKEFKVRVAQKVANQASLSLTEEKASEDLTPMNFGQFAALSISYIKLKVIQAFAKDDQALRESLNVSSQASEMKKSREKALEAKEEFNRGTRQERRLWDRFLERTGITLSA